MLEHLYIENIALIDRLEINFKEGDKVRAPKYGIGIVKSISPGGADFEVEVSFGEKGIKKFMAGLSKLKKIEE